MLYKNQAIKQFFTTGINNDVVKEIVLKYKSPDGVEGMIDEDIEVSIASNGTYYIDIANDFFNQAGTWVLWSQITDTDDNIFPGTPFTIEVLEEGVGKYPVTKEIIKSYLGIADTLQDTAIEALIPALIEAFLNIRNAPFDVQNGVTLYPVGFEFIISKMYEHITKKNGDVSSEHIGNYSASYITTNAFPPSITSLIKRYVRGI